MSRDYKPNPSKSSSKSGTFFSGLLLGILLGVGASVGLTMYINKTDSPFRDKKINAPSAKELAAKAGDKGEAGDSAIPKEEGPNNKKTGSDYDFYTILPETESTVTEQEIKEKKSPVKKDSYFLQVGAFPNETDADNMKAKLALQGFEAVVQTANIPNKGTWHRVRVGPLQNVEQINKVRGELTTAGFNTDLIKVHTETPQ
jgi:hypothetical protein